MAVRELPKDVLKMASGLISPSGWPGHCRQLCIVAAGPCSREGKEVRLQDKWARLLMAWLGWAEEEDLTSWAGRVRGGWAEQLQVLR